MAGRGGRGDDLREGFGVGEEKGREMRRGLRCCQIMGRWQFDRRRLREGQELRRGELRRGEDRLGRLGEKGRN